jgi:hypothetical protein
MWEITQTRVQEWEWETGEQNTATSLSLSQMEDLSQPPDNICSSEFVPKETNAGKKLRERKT